MIKYSRSKKNSTCRHAIIFCKVNKMFQHKKLWLLDFWIFDPFDFFYNNLQFTIFFWRNNNLPFLRSIEFTTNVDLQILAVKMSFHAILLPHFGKDVFKLPTSRLLIVSLRWIKSVKCVNFKCIQNFLNQISLRKII